MIAAHFLADEITGAPDNGWTALGVVGGALVTALVIVAYKLTARWMTTRSELQVGEERYDTTGMSAELVHMLSTALNRATNAETSAKEAKDESHALRKDLDNLTESRGLLAAELARTRRGVTEGTIPPLHELPPDLVHLVEPE